MHCASIFWVVLIATGCVCFLHSEVTPPEVDADQGIAYKNAGCNIEDDLGNSTGLCFKPPYYFMVFSCIMKPMVTAVVFGPTRPTVPDQTAWGRTKSAAKVALRCAFLAMAVHTAAQDVEAAYKAITTSASWKQGALGVVVVLATSSNVPAGAAAWGTLELLQLSSDWLHVHGVAMDVATMLGQVGLVYTAFFMYTYIPLSIVILLWSAVHIACNIKDVVWYLAGGIVVLFFLGCFVPPASAQLLKVIRGSPRQLMIEAKTTKADKTKVTRRMQAIFPCCEQTYDQQWETFADTGVLDRGWKLFWTYIILISVPPGLVAVVSSRLALGMEAEDAVVLTIGERHFVVYATVVLSSVRSIVSFIWLVV